MGTCSSEYKRKLTTAEKAAGLIKSGDTIITGMAYAEPPALMAAIADRARQGSLKDLKVYLYGAQKTAQSTLLSPDLCDYIQPYTWFVAATERSQVKVGLDYYVPNYFHQLPSLIRDFMDVDMTITTVSPMDDSGYFSFGLANDYTTTAARCCKKLIVEVNKNMPRVFGDSLLHISEVDAIVENDVPIVETTMPKATPVDEKIGSIIAGMVPDGATLQIGTGGTPNVVTQYLGNHKDLGVHSEVLGIGIVDLIRKGVVTGRKKTLHPRKNVFTLASGNREMFDFINDNPSMESYPVSYTNDPDVIARNDNMISVNAILEVDLLGQCNAEFLAGKQFSGTGGQLEWSLRDQRRLREGTRCITEQ